MLLRTVVGTSARVGATRSRTTKIHELTQALTDARDAGVVALVTSYLSGTLPQRRIGVGWRGLATLPQPAAESTLRVDEVDAAFTSIAAEAGPGSAARRATAIADLFARATAEEQVFLSGLVTGELRHGALDGLMLQAVARAAELPETAVRRAVMLAGFTAPVAQAALEGGREALDAITLQVGRPLRPMLAASAPDVPAAMADLGDVALERKVDGIRVQIHVHHGEVGIHTRTLEDVTSRMPEIVEAARAWPVQSAVADGEVIVLRDDGRPAPFQATGARTASRTDPATLRQTAPLTVFLFDLLHLDGADLLDLPAAQRFDALARVVPADQLVPRVVTSDVDVATHFFTEQVAAGHEGVVVKSLATPYAAGRRGAGWVKVKPRHTLDLVVVAVEWGSGRRTGLLSNIHLAARDGQGFVMLGKTFKGMTDEVLAWQTERFLALETSRSGHVVHVRPEQVVEIAFDGLQRSSRYPGGLALRFARVLRYRDDKTAEQADTMEAVRALVVE